MSNYKMKKISLKTISNNIIFLCLFVFVFAFYSNGGGSFKIPHLLLLLAEVVFLLNTFALLGKNIQNGKKSSSIIIYLIIVVIMSYCIGLMNYNGQERDVDNNTDLMICFIAINGFILLRYDKESILKFVILTAISTIFVTLLELSRIDLLDVLPSILVDRSSLWNNCFPFVASFFWYVQFLLVYSVVLKKNYGIALFAFGLFALLNLLATKRQFMVETAWLLCLILYYLYKTKCIKEFRNIIIILLAALFIFLIVGKVLNLDISFLFEATQSRFDKDDVETSGFVRFVESEVYFDSASFIDVIFGRGLGVPHHGLEGPNTALHIGITNLILKFGLFVAPLFVILVLKLLPKLLKIEKYAKTDPWLVVCLLSAFATIPSFFFLANCWTFTPGISFFVYTLMYSYYNGSKHNYQKNQKIS